MSKVAELSSWTLPWTNSELASHKDQIITTVLITCSDVKKSCLLKISTCLVVPAIILAFPLSFFSCYVVALSQNRAFSKLAPIGGFMFMAGWLAFAF